MRLYTAWGKKVSTQHLKGHLRELLFEKKVQVGDPRPFATSLPDNGAQQNLEPRKQEVSARGGPTQLTWLDTVQRRTCSAAVSPCPEAVASGNPKLEAFPKVADIGSGLSPDASGPLAGRTNR